MKGFSFALSARRKKTPWAREQKITPRTAGNRTLQETPLHQTATTPRWGGVLCVRVCVSVRTHAQTKEMRVHSADKSTGGNNFLRLEEK